MYGTLCLCDVSLICMKSSETILQLLLSTMRTYEMGLYDDMFVDQMYKPHGKALDIPDR